MPNTQTSVPAFTSGQVLTAAQMTEVNTGIPVFATTTTRDAAFGGTGEKTLAEGQFAYIEDSNVVQYYDGATWATVGPAAAAALVLISTTTITNGVTSVAVSNAFSSTYDNYKIVVSGGGGTDANLTMVLGATTTGYYWTYTRTMYGNTASTSAGSNDSSFGRFGYANTDGLNASVDVINPNLAKNTFIVGASVQNNTGAGAGAMSGFVNNTTQYTGFTVAGTTFTGGTIRVYGYANS